MRRDPVTIVWVVGIVVTALIYLAGPEHFFYWLFDLIDRGWYVLERAIEDLSRSAFNLLRAATIGLFVVFVSLNLMVIRAGRRGRVALFLVSGTFLLLVWHDRPVSNAAWVAALVLVGIAASVMTARLRGGSR